jgi:hypothetical protein
MAVDMFSPGCCALPWAVKGVHCDTKKARCIMHDQNYSARLKQNLGFTIMGKQNGAFTKWTIAGGLSLMEPTYD